MQLPRKISNFLIETNSIEFYSKLKKRSVERGWFPSCATIFLTKISPTEIIQASYQIDIDSNNWYLCELYLAFGLLQPVDDQYWLFPPYHWIEFKNLDDLLNLKMTCDDWIGYHLVK